MKSDLVKRLREIHSRWCRVVEPPYGDCNCHIGKTGREAADIIEAMELPNPEIDAAIESKATK